MKKIVLLLMLTALCHAKVEPREMTTSSLKAMGAPNNPRVEIAWNRYYDSKELGELESRLAKTFPELVSFESIGESVQHRPINCLIVTNKKTGNDLEKPGFYIDGNIHSNEVQGAEVALYTAWYLVENYGQVEWITDLVDRVAFYIIPTINPDARDHFIHFANTAHSPRSGLLPRDEDGDGVADEDGMDDLDGDGNIVMMRKKDNLGQYIPHPDDPRLMKRAEPGEPGQYRLLGWEGIDNDGDGRINEDGPGYYDPNRNWGFGWEPDYAQHGADQYPFSIPENRAVAEFVSAHPNIIGAQSYHNSGGMILRGPGGEEYNKAYIPEDLRVYDVIGKEGEKMLPGYEYMIIYKDLYSAYGGELDWFYGSMGIYTYSNELWTAFSMFQKEDKSDQSWFGRQTDVYKFDKLLLFGEGVVDWKPYNHPTYGEIEIGGTKKSWTRTAPSFLLEEMCHRNMAFTLYHAYQSPLLKIESTTVKPMGGDLYQIDVKISNHRLVPTRAYYDVQNDITRGDMITLTGPKVVAGFVVTDPDMNLAVEQKYRPEKLKVNSIEGLDSIYLRWIVKGKKQFTIQVDSVKGGKIISKDKI